MNVISQQLTMPYAAQVLLYTHAAWNAGTQLSTVFNLLIKQGVASQTGSLTKLSVSVR